MSLPIGQTRGPRHLSNCNNVAQNIQHEAPPEKLWSPQRRSRGRPIIEQEYVRYVLPDAASQGVCGGRGWRGGQGRHGTARRLGKPAPTKSRYPHRLSNHGTGYPRASITVGAFSPGDDGGLLFHPSWPGDHSKHVACICWGRTLQSDRNVKGSNPFERKFLGRHAGRTHGSCVRLRA